MSRAFWLIMSVLIGVFLALALIGLLNDFTDRAGSLVGGWIGH